MPAKWKRVRRDMRADLMSRPLHKPVMVRKTHPADDWVVIGLGRVHSMHHCTASAPSRLKAARLHTLAPAAEQRNRQPMPNNGVY